MHWRVTYCSVEGVAGPLLVAEGQRPADQPLDPQPPGALVDVGVDDRLVDGVVEPVAGDLGGEATDRPGGRVVATGGARRRADRGGAGRAGQGLAAGVADPAGEPAHGVPGGQQPGGPDGGPEQLPPGPAQPAGRGRDRVALQPAEGAAQDAHVGHRGRRHHRAVQQQRRRPRLGPVATEGDQAEQPPGQPRRPAAIGGPGHQHGGGPAGQDAGRGEADREQPQRPVAEQVDEEHRQRPGDQPQQPLGEPEGREREAGLDDVDEPEHGGGHRHRGHPGHEALGGAQATFHGSTITARPGLGAAQGQPYGSWTPP